MRVLTTTLYQHSQKEKRQNTYTDADTHTPQTHTSYLSFRDLIPSPHSTAQLTALFSQVTLILKSLRAFSVFVAVFSVSTLNLVPCVFTVKTQSHLDAMRYCQGVTQT